MTQEQKDLLLKDLCARLPYGVKIDEGYKGDDVKPPTLLKVDIVYVNDNYPIESVKPYLRPMSSMTSAEEYEYHQLREEDANEVIKSLDSLEHLKLLMCPILARIKSVDWLNAHHFDYRGLIPMGLAIKVTEKNNPYKD